jgi:hypothetical protein
MLKRGKAGIAIAALAAFAVLAATGMAARSTGDDAPAEN